MPKYIQPIKVNGKRRYAVFSTITMSFHSKLHPTLKSLRKKYPKLKVKRKALLGKQLKNGQIRVSMPVIRIPKSTWKKYARKG